MFARQDAASGQPAAASRVPGTTAAGASSAADDKPVMHVKVASPYRVYFDQDAYSLSALNSTGPFDILPRHHNFITLLDAGELVIHTPAGRPRIRISGGLMHVKADRVTVFLDV